MRLLTKYNRINLLATILIFLLASTTFYVAIRYILIGQVDDDLKIEQREIETYVKEHNVLPESIPVKDQKISYAPASELSKESKFKTVSGFAAENSEKNSYRILQFSVIANGKMYSVTVAKSLQGTDELINSILLITFVTILVMLVVSLAINRILLKRLWQPFYDTLNLLKKFKLDKKQPVNFPPTNIDEFAIMNQTLERTTRQARQDYLLLKEFTENASHEMQTPLAIIRSKLDLLIQNESISEDQSKTIQSAYTAVEKLSRLNQSLLLLAKIENNQFAETSTVNLEEKIEEKIKAFNELWQSQNISVSASVKNAVVNMNPELADILFNNLFGNATRHNIPNGSVRIELSPKQLKITNTSDQKELDRERLFTRFSKTTSSTGYTGLGLSIIKQICDASGFIVNYSFEKQLHSFAISW
jgi:signal transduction histidine kinase